MSESKAGSPHKASLSVSSSYVFLDDNMPSAPPDKVADEQQLSTGSGEQVEEVEEVEEEVEYIEEEEEEVVYEDGPDEGEAASEGASDSDQASAKAVEAPPPAKVSQPVEPPPKQQEAVGSEPKQPAEDKLEAAAAATVPVKAEAPSPPTTDTDEVLPTSVTLESGGAESSAVGAAPSGVDIDLKQLEAQAAKVAAEVTHLAKDMSNKLTAGIRSAFGTDATAAGASLTKLAGGLSSWWGSLDPAPQPVHDETAERVASSNKASGELQQLFGLVADENLVEHFKCKLLQTYACNHNSFTPAIQMAFQGTLYVTDKHTCFTVEERGRKVPFKVAHSQVVQATRQRPPRKGDLSDLLKMELSGGQSLCFKDFDSGSALDSALALVEHLTDANEAH